MRKARSNFSGIKPKKLCKFVFWVVLFTTSSIATAKNSFEMDSCDAYWMRIITPNFDILARSNLITEAMRVANTLEQLYGPISKSFGIKPNRTTVILKNQIATSNGFVMPGFFSMRLGGFACFYTFPPQCYNMLGVNDWLTNLAVHEFRHVVQLERVSSKFTFAVPHICFFEGDSVDTETLFSKSGRGRIPYFSLLYRTFLLNGKDYSFIKQLEGSTKDPVADYYKVGYFMTTYMRRHYGEHIWIDVMGKPNLFSTFDGNVTKITGKSLLQIYDALNIELKNLWHRQLEGLEMTQVKSITHQNKCEFTGYYHPKLDSNGNIIAFKSGMDTVGCFVMIDINGLEKKLITVGSYGPKEIGFSIYDNKLIWVEEVPALVMGTRKQSYSVIKCYDIPRKKEKLITHNSRYGSAALSPNGSEIVAFESDESYNHRLVILDAHNGEVIHEIPNPSNNFYTTPSWSNDGKYIVVREIVNQTNSILQIDTTTWIVKNVIPYSEEHLGNPIMYNQYIFYNSAYSGIDNIYVVDTNTGNRYQVTCRPYGAYNPVISADGQRIIFNDFTKDGMSIVEIPFDTTKWISLEKVEDRSVNYFEPLLEQEPDKNALESIPNVEYPIKKYSPWSNIYRIVRLKRAYHTFLNRMGGVKISTKDFLDLASISCGVCANLDYKTKNNEKPMFGIPLKIKYKELYPIIDVHAFLELFAEHDRHHIFGENNCLGLPTGTKVNRKKIPTQNVGATIKLPLTFKYNQFNCMYTIGISGDLYSNKEKWVVNGYKSSFGIRSPKTVRDMFSPLSNVIVLEFLHSPYTKDVQGYSFGAALKTGLPGLFKHHSIQLNNCMSINENKKIPKASCFSYVSSSGVLTEEEAHKYSRIAYVSGITYVLPLWYVDKNIWIFFCKGLYANILYEFVYLPNKTKDIKSPQTVGLGLMVNLGFSGAPFLFGGNALYMIDTGKLEYAPVFELNLVLG